MLSSSVTTIISTRWYQKFFFQVYRMEFKRSTPYRLIYKTVTRGIILLKHSFILQKLKSFICYISGHSRAYMYLSRENRLLNNAYSMPLLALVRDISFSKSKQLIDGLSTEYMTLQIDTWAFKYSILKKKKKVDAITNCMSQTDYYFRTAFTFSSNMSESLSTMSWKPAARDSWYSFCSVVISVPFSSKASEHTYTKSL